MDKPRSLRISRRTRAGGVKSVVAQRLLQVLELGEAAGIIISTPAKTKSNQQIANDLAEQQLATADQGVKISAIVMLHTACERFLWRLARFGLVANRAQALERIYERKATVKALVDQGVDDSLDAVLEKWWGEFERDTLMNKWKRLVALAGFPPKLHDGRWHFDRAMLEEFDAVRHDAVHHDGAVARDFDFAGFAEPLWRAQVVWVVHVGLQLHLKIAAETMFGLHPGAPGEPTTPAARSR